MSRIGASLPLVQESPVTAMSRAGTIWSTCRVTPSDLKFALQDSTSQLPRSARIRFPLQPFRGGRFPGHFRCTLFQGTCFSRVLNRALQYRHRRRRYPLRVGPQ